MTNKIQIVGKDNDPKIADVTAANELTVIDTNSSGIADLTGALESNDTDRLLVELYNGSVRATIKDFVNGDPLLVVLSDLSGNAIVNIGIASGANTLSINGSGEITESNSAGILTSLQTIDNFISGSRGLVTEDNSADILTSLQTIDNIVSGNEAQVDIVTQPALANTVDSIASYVATDKIMDGTTELTPKFKSISASSSGDNTLVAAVSGKKIRPVYMVLIAKTAVDVRLEDGAGGTALSGVISLDDKSGWNSGYVPVGFTETSSNTLLNLELSAAVQVSGMLVYIEVPS